MEGEIGTIIKFAFFSGLRTTELIYSFETEICPDLSGYNCEKLHILQKPNGYSVIILNRIVGRKHSYFAIMPTALWESFKSLSIKITKQETKIAHDMVKSVTSDKAILMDLRKFHYNILCRSGMGERGADVLAGRTNSFSAKHYLIHELDSMTEEYDKAMRKFITPKLN